MPMQAQMTAGKGQASSTLMATDEAARLLGIDEDTLKSWTETGFIGLANGKEDGAYRLKDLLALQNRLFSN